MQRTKEQFQTFQPHGGNPSQNFGLRVRRGLTPPHTLTSTGGGGREVAGDAIQEATDQGNFRVLEARGDPWRNFGSRGQKGLTPHARLYVQGGRQ